MTTPDRSIRILFVKPLLGWPRTTGHDVYCYHMMKGIAALGAEVSLATIEKTDPRAVDGIPLAFCGRLSDADASPPPLKLTWAQERFRSFWGITREQIGAVRRLADSTRADVVVAFGLPSLPFLAGVDHAVRVWAMADEWVYHHLTQVRLFDRSSWAHARSALVKGVYERSYRTLVDRAWAVSDTDVRAGRWFAGIQTVDFVPNGVDTDFFHPLEEVESPRTAVFWGRLDFEPNVDALAWFCGRVWPDVVRRVSDARFTIIGYNPTPAVERLAALPGITILPNVPDLRSAACQHAVVVLPIVSGGGIKNKLLEGAALGRPILATPRACLDLRPRGALPIVQARRPDAWVTELIALWDDEARRRALGRQARAWVSEYYSWAASARTALEAFKQSVERRTSRSAARGQPAPRLTRGSM